MLVISAHADTNFQAHSLRRGPNGEIRGHLDNFAGVHAVLRAYFSGRLSGGQVRIELTHGEEVDFAGARAVLPTLDPDDLVVVVDVTGVPTNSALTIEKCRSKALEKFLRETLEPLAPDINPSAPDPVADADESDVYSVRCPHSCFLGVVCGEGDYNEGEALSNERSIEAVSEALCRLAENYERWEQMRPRTKRRRRPRLHCTIRHPRKQDHRAWQSMREQLWPDCTIDELPLALAAGEVLLAQAPNGEFVGFCELALRDFAEGCTTSPVAYLEGWWVDPVQRRRGVGRALIDAARRWARRQGAEEFASDAESENVLSQLAHESLGFERAGDLVAYRMEL